MLSDQVEISIALSQTSKIVIFVSKQLENNWFLTQYFSKPVTSQGHQILKKAPCPADIPLTTGS